MKNTAKLFTVALAFAVTVLSAQDSKALTSAVVPGSAFSVYTQKNLPKNFDMDLPDAEALSVAVIRTAVPDAEARLAAFLKDEQKDDDNRSVMQGNKTVTVVEKDGDVKTAVVSGPDLIMFSKQTSARIHAQEMVPQRTIAPDEPGLAISFTAQYNNNIVKSLRLTVIRTKDGLYQMDGKFASNNKSDAALRVIRAYLADELDDEPPALLKKLAVSADLNFNALLTAKELDEAWDVLKDFDPSDTDD